MKRLLTTLLLACSTLVGAADLFDNAKPRPYKLADPLESNATIGGYPIWAGESKWRIYKMDRWDSTGGPTTVPIGGVGLFQTEGKQFVAIMNVSATLSNASLRWGGEPCKRDDYLYRANIGRSIWEDNCVTINHLAAYGNNPGGKDAELYALFVENGISPPPTVIRIEFTRNGTSGNFYRIQLNINPEVMGFARENEVSWGRNPWNKTMSFNDPAKKQFIDALGAWALQFAKQMDPALVQKSDAFSAIPSWRLVLDGQPKPESKKEKVVLD